MQAPTGRAAFRFLNQAVTTGAVDIYFVPAGTAIAEVVPLVTNLPVSGPVLVCHFPGANRDHDHHAHRSDDFGIHLQPHPVDRR